jgi:ABC-type Fe3+/spermidine/putrescine transport system ATPase subunit
VGALHVSKLITGNGHRLTATIRPEDVIISANSHQGIEGIVRTINFEGTITRIRVQIQDNDYVALTTEQGFSAGQPVRLYFPPEKIRIFPHPTDENRD